MSHWTDQEQSQILAELCRRSSVDSEFRQLALRDPARAIAKVTTKTPPPGLSFRFVDPADRTPADPSGSARTIVLPDPIPETAELSDTELESVAGGNFTSTAGYTP
jgi:hypothetical protein